MKIRELLDSPEKWTQGTYSQRSDGSFCSWLNAKAVKWCLDGATRKCYPTKYPEIKDRIRLELNNEITLWNDAPERTFEDVKKLVEKLDI